MRNSIQEILEFLVEEEDRLDRFLARAYPDFSRSYLQRLIEEGYVLVENQVITKPSKRLKPGEKVLLLVPEPEPLEIPPENIPIRIVYEDAHLLVVVKPCGMVVHPSPGYTTGTLVNAQKFAIVEGGKYAKSEFFVKERFPKHNATLLEVRLHTGRTHQIRVHVSALGHPILGDRTYGFKQASVSKEILELMGNCHMLLSYKL
jgi:23S rRNA-/tRNA-specific pseudouridylate synthase